MHIMHKESSGRANAHNAPHIRRMRTRTPLPREARQTQPRERHAVAPSGLLRERRLWSCAVNCAATPRRSCMRQQLESSRTASRPTHPLLARGSRATASRRSRRQRVAPREEKHAGLRCTTGTQHRRRAAMKLRQPRGAWCTPSAAASRQLDGTRCV